MDNELNKCGCGNDCGCNHEHDHEGCGCGHDHDHEHGLEHMVIDLETEDGNIVSCPIVDAFEFEGAEYVLAQDPDGESTYLFRGTETGELEVPDEEEFDRVAAHYETLVDEE